MITTTLEPCPLIGPAKPLAERLVATAGDRLKLLFYGPPGVGKTALAEWIAVQLAGKFDIESINGRNLTIGVARQWMQDLQSMSLYSTWRIRIVNEVDTAPADTQDALLSLLDEMPTQRGFIGTSNLQIKELSERFRTRLEKYKITAPAQDEILALLLARGMAAEPAKMAAATCGGNVRQALIDAAAWLRQNEPKARVKVVQSDWTLLGM